MHTDEQDFGHFRIYAAAFEEGGRYRPAVAVRDRCRLADAPLYMNCESAFRASSPDVALQYAIELGQLGVLGR